LGQEQTIDIDTLTARADWKRVLRRRQQLWQIIPRRLIAELTREKIDQAPRLGGQ
jgi:hypothetical protein